MTECWSTIGVRGDHSCLELIKHVHCHNCPVYSSVARSVLDRDVSPAYLSRWTGHFAKPKPVIETQSMTLLVVRVGAEWLALPTSVVVEITQPQPVRSLPHRRAGILLGLTNVRGELLICVSLRHVLGLDARPPGPEDAFRPAQQRVLVVRREGVRVACVVDEVDGIYRCGPSEVATLPPTVARASSSHSRGIASIHGRPIGVLDDNRVFATIQRGLA
ncbi:MAG TPA: chemotaxis protein CheW [Vicinamibacterales bacterium]|nr:chemotaxis protein CheW [Vicinamibacterales bacterium]